MSYVDAADHLEKAKAMLSYPGADPAIGGVGHALVALVELQLAKFWDGTKACATCESWDGSPGDARGGCMEERCSVLHSDADFYCKLWKRESKA